MKNSKQVGNKRNGYNMITAQVESKKNVLNIFRDALKNEFNNNGVKVGDSKGSSSDAINRVGLKEFWSDVRIKFWEIVMIGTVDADIIIRDPKKNSEKISRSINGTFRESRQIAVDEAYESVLNGALAEFVRNFSRNPDILKALRLAKRTTETTSKSKPVAPASK
ncbi:MAG: YajG family lipoprotein, partial [Nitrospinota bacterium]